MDTVQKPGNSEVLVISVPTAVAPSKGEAYLQQKEKRK
jgi:hypothetical protein